MENWEKYKNESTETLIKIIQRKSEQGCEEIARAAFCTLCFRFQTEVISNIRAVVPRWGYDFEIADEIAYNAFDRFWKYPKFKLEKCKTQNIDKCFIFYLHTICRRLLINHKKNVELISAFNGNEEIVFDFPKFEKSAGDEKKLELIEISKKIDTALNKLGKKHKAIYLTYKAYEKNGKKLPRTLLKKLRIELGLTQNTIRFYKKEANEITQQILSEHAKR